MMNYPFTGNPGSLILALIFSISMFGLSSVPPGDNDPGDNDDSAITSVADGFEVQLLYNVPRQSMGSWVSFSVLPDGSFIASDQRENRMYRVTLEGDEDHPDVHVEQLVLPLTSAYGTVWAFDHLYANVNGSGLFRLRDENGDSRLNLLEFLGGPFNESEHGNHTVVKTHDGEGLYYVAGNHTPPPSDLAVNRLSGWEEDLLLPRVWDARGHARGVLSPGGWIARINPEATEWEMISIGYRNEYDIAVNSYGEVFTFDADMEWDMGMPWYRPTRIAHVVSGSDYGWRSGSGKWPDYFEDSLPVALNVGPGSPTGVVFGTGTKFPAKYQHAMFALDWTFGTIYAIHFTPEGASYKAEAEEFLTGSPLPVTNAVVGKDGALYFVTGGRNQDSQIYRVVYRGDESTEPAEPADDPEAKEARELRHHLEFFHGRQHPDAISTAWPYLSSEDRFIRHAARVAIEAQPVSDWSERALSEADRQARITSLVALARTGSQEYRSHAIESLLDMNTASLSAEQKLGMLRAMSLVFMRLGDPDEFERERISDELHNMLPDSDDRVNTELIRNLVYLRDPAVTDKAIALIRDRQQPEGPDWSETLLERNMDYGGVIKEMIENPPPTRELEYAFMLRTHREGWTVDLRREYFSFINEAADRDGGMSYSGFLEDMRTEALRNSTEEEREAVADLTGISLAQSPDFALKAPEGPGRDWTLDEAIRVVRDQSDEPDYENGRNAFFVTSCVACHRFDRYGGDSGPDLTNVANRFSVTGILEKMIEPNNLVSDQYSSSEVTLVNGESYTGLPVTTGDTVTIYPRNPDLDPVSVSRSEVESVRKLEISQMPENLINSLNEDELRDLLAYLQSGGDPDHEVFQPEEDEEEEGEGSEDEEEEQSAQ